VEDKGALRQHLAAARRVRTVEQRRQHGVSLAEHAAGAWRHARRVAVYVDIGTEPPTHELIDQLSAAGVQLLLPVIEGDELAWGEFLGWDRLAVGPGGVPAPVPRAGVGLADVDVALVPALAVDRRGVRLGGGGGYYDRALREVEPARAVAVVYAEEVVERLPEESHDRRVGFALTPDGLLRLSG
jgi:5-formyltetrahydrofolate cyclo-ligase